MLEKLSATLADMGAKGKVIIGLSIAVLISAVVVLVIVTGMPSYQVLYSNLTQADAAGVVEKLKERNIPYKLDGNAISVPDEVIYEARLQLAADGLPRGGGVGFEIFDKSGFGVSEFVQKINYMRAIQGELSRTIMSIDEVDTARVHIVAPEKKLFSGNAETARASVVIRLRGSNSISKNQVQGIVNLVAGSVQGLSTSNITIVDTNGNMLTRSIGEDDSISLSTSQFDYQKNIENSLETRIVEILAPVVGHGKIQAKVSAEIDFKQVQKTEERFDPDSVVVRSEQSSKEKSRGAVSGGVPGVASNVPGGSAVGGDLPGQPGSERQNETINYEISKVVSTTIEPSGTLKRLSVAVLVDGKYSPGATAESSYEAWNEVELKKFRDLIKGTVGFSTERGDTLDVVNIAFGGRVEIEEIEEATMLDKYLPDAIRYGTVLLISLILLLLVVRPLMRGLFSKPERERSLVADGAPSPSGSATYAGGNMPADLEETEEGMRKKYVSELIKQNPQQTASILKRWLNEKDNKHD